MLLIVKLNNIRLIKQSKKNKTMEEIADSFLDEDVAVVINLDTAKSTKEALNNTSNETMSLQQACKSAYNKTMEKIKNIYFNSLNPVCVDFTESVKFLIALFKSTGCIYRCTTTKLGKLLTISALIGAKNGVQLFSEPIKDQNCGTTFSRLSWEYDYDIYPKDGCKDDCSPVPTALYCKAAAVEANLSKETQDLLRSTFFNFASYPAHEIGCLIDEFKSAFIEDGFVDLQKAFTYLNCPSSICNSNQNDLECYIRNFDWSIVDNAK